MMLRIFAFFCLVAALAEAKSLEKLGSKKVSTKSSSTAHVAPVRPANAFTLLNDMTTSYGFCRMDHPVAQGIPNEGVDVYGQDIWDFSGLDLAKSAHALKVASMKYTLPGHSVFFQVVQEPLSPYDAQPGWFLTDLSRAIKYSVASLQDLFTAQISKFSRAGLKAKIEELLQSQKIVIRQCQLNEDKPLNLQYLGSDDAINFQLFRDATTKHVSFLASLRSGEFMSRPKDEILQDMISGDYCDKYNGYRHPFDFDSIMLCPNVLNEQYMHCFDSDFGSWYNLVETVAPESKNDQGQTELTLHWEPVKLFSVDKCYRDLTWVRDIAENPKLNEQLRNLPSHVISKDTDMLGKIVGWIRGDRN